MVNACRPLTEKNLRKRFASEQVKSFLRTLKRVFLLLGNFFLEGAETQVTKKLASAICAGGNFWQRSNSIAEANKHLQQTAMMFHNERTSDFALTINWDGSRDSQR